MEGFHETATPRKTPHPWKGGVHTEFSHECAPWKNSVRLPLKRSMTLPAGSPTWNALFLTSGFPWKHCSLFIGYITHSTISQMGFPVECSVHSMIFQWDILWELFFPWDYPRTFSTRFIVAPMASPGSSACHDIQDVAREIPWDFLWDSKKSFVGGCLWFSSQCGFHRSSIGIHSRTSNGIRGILHSALPWQGLGQSQYDPMRNIVDGM